MDPRPGPQLVVEPWVETDGVAVSALETGGGGGSGGGLAGGVAAVREGREDWVEVTVGLVGGEVRAGGGGGGR